MKNFRGEIILKPRNLDKHAIEEIGSAIHHQLVGNQDYIDSNIGIELNTEGVVIWIDKVEHGERPDIIL